MALYGCTHSEVFHDPATETKMLMAWSRCVLVCSFRGTGGRPLWYLTCLQCLRADLMPARHGCMHTCPAAWAVRKQARTLSVCQQRCAAHGAVSRAHAGLTRAVLHRVLDERAGRPAGVPQASCALGSSSPARCVVLCAVVPWHTQGAGHDTTCKLCSLQAHAESRSVQTSTSKTPCRRQTLSHEAAGRRGGRCTTPSGAPSGSAPRCTPASSAAGGTTGLTRRCSQCVDAVPSAIQRSASCRA